MRSQWYKYKTNAIRLRQEGLSIRTIESKLKISKSTLSYWFKDIVLSKEKKDKIRADWLNALGKARKKAVKWHNAQKVNRLVKAEEEAKDTLKRIKVNNKEILDLSLAMLYLGEGSKGSSGTAIGNSNPLILKFFIKVLIKNYSLKLSDIKAELHIRADQDPDQVKNFWAKELRIPKTNFLNVSVDQRTKGSPTYSTYQGVCIVRCGRFAIQRKLMFLSKLFCESIE